MLCGGAGPCARPPGALLREAAAREPLAALEPARAARLWWAEGLRRGPAPPPGLPPVPLQPEVGLAFDADGIARLVASTASSLAAAAPTPAVSPAAIAAGGRGGLTGEGGDALAGCAPVEHSGADGVALSARIREALSASGRAVVDVTGHCAEGEPLEVSGGEVLVRGCADGAARARLALPGLRVTGGSLRLARLELCASEENRVRAGELRCTDCFITARNGCGVLCLQGAKVHLTGCEVSHCMRSGVGINGKNTELHLRDCVIERNNFSGIGINHQARKIQFHQNRITGNGYHGIWLNVGVVATWDGGDLSGNKLSDKDGPGTLIGFSACTEHGVPAQSAEISRLAVPPHQEKSNPDAD